MRICLFAIAMLFVVCSGYSQTNVGINNATPDPSAALDVTSTTQGILVPRMTKAQRDVINMVSGISTPANGLMIFQTDNTPGFYYYTAGAWSPLSGGSGPKLQVSVYKTTAQVTAVGSSFTTPELIPFQSPNAGSLTNSNTWDGTTFTVGTSGAGLYSIDLRLTGQITHAIPMLDVNETGVSSTSVYGTGVSYTSGGSGILTAAYSKRGLLYTTLYLAPGNTLKVRASSSSTVVGADLNADASTRFTIIKLN